GPVADVVFRLLEQVEEALDRLAGDLDRLEQRPAGIRDAVDAPMSLVPTWIAQMMLHVSDDGILPIEEIHGAVRADLDRVRAEIRVGGINDRLQFSAAVARALFADLVLENALEADHVGDEIVALEIVGKMSAAQNGGARRGARPLVKDRLHFRVLARVIDMSRESRRVVIHVPRPVRDKILTPAIEDMAMRIGERIGDIHLELLSPRLIAIDPGVSATLRRSIGRFDLRAVKHAFLKIQRPARIEHKAVSGVMRDG